MLKTGWILALSFLALSLVQAGQRTAEAWPFGEKENEWMRGGSGVHALRVENGVLSGEIAGEDPFLCSPYFLLKTTAHQTVVFRAKVAKGGDGELFWTPHDAPAPQQKWSVRFSWIGDGAWHEYRIRPFWQSAGKIKQFRIDFPVLGKERNAFSFADIRIEEDDTPVFTGAPVWTSLASWKKDGNGWASPPLSVDSGERYIAVVCVKAKHEGVCEIFWANDRKIKKSFKNFRIKPGEHTYQVDMDGNGWAGKIEWIQVVPPAGAELCSFSLADDFQGPPSLCLDQIRMEDTLNRVGRPAGIWMQLSNCGGSDAKDAEVTISALPDGVTLVSSEGWNRVQKVPAGEKGACRFQLLASRPVKGTLAVTVSCNGSVQAKGECTVEFLPDLHLPKATYVPEPKPLKSEYEIGALYFPGWATVKSWARIWPVAPERKPVLGWYDETNPEVVDWQIKWAVENGIQYLLVDWYWCKGQRSLEHWIKAFQKAKYRRYLKWAMMWANHTEKGSHSEEDQRAVTQYWIDHYFNTPEYYRINDMPVVNIWNPANYDRDLGPGGCRRMLELSRSMARAAGYKGIWFIAMKWPEASASASVVQECKDRGFDMTSIYHYMANGGKSVEKGRIPFDDVAASNASLWEGLYKTGILPFLPGLSTGWDDRPWNNHLEIYGRTPEKFARICADAKAFADKTGIKNLLIGPLNEWGEGSYAEPNSQYGFRMYEAVRDTFCKQPQDGWPLNYTPRDVGLGPYDLPMPEEKGKNDSDEWVFRNGDLRGWSAFVGIRDAKVGRDGLSFVTTHRDPILSVSFPHRPAGKYGKLIVRMKVTGVANDVCQIFWSRGGSLSEVTSLRLPLVADGAFHDYVFDLSGCVAWRGRISGLRFDPCSSDEAGITIDSIRLVKKEKIIFCAPHSRESNLESGSADRPFSTLARTMAAVRAAGPSGVVVKIKKARYACEEIVFGEKDSGTEGEPVTYLGDGAEITSSKILSPSAFRLLTAPEMLSRLEPAARGKVMEADLTALGIPAGKKFAEHFRMPSSAPELFFGEDRMRLSCWPNEGWTTIAKIIDSGTFSHDGSCREQREKKESPRGGVFQYEGDRPSRWRVEEGVWVHGFWCFDWYDEAMRVSAIDTVKKTITLSGPHVYGVRQGNPSPRRWRVINLFDELDQPGEYCVDVKNNKLYFWPPAPLSEKRVTLAYENRPLIRMKGAHDIVLKGFTLDESQGDGIIMENCRNVVLDGCIIRNIRKAGIYMANGVSNVIRHCKLSELGSGGVTLGGGNRKTLEPGGNLLENTHIWNYSVHLLTYASALHFTGVGNIARHNEIHGAPHMAVGVYGNDNIFEYNVVSNVCMASDDAAAFYKGRNPSCRGNVIRYNLWSEIGSPRGHGNAAIYFDDGDGGDIVYGNLFFRCGDPGKGSFGSVFSHGGHDNLVSNCLFIACKRALGSSPWSDKNWKAYIDASLWQTRLLKEVDITRPPYTTHYPALVGFMQPVPGVPRVNRAENNLFVDCKEMKSGNWATNATNVALSGDPGFADYANRDFRLKPDSRAFHALPAFKPLPVGEFGIQKQ